MRQALKKYGPWFAAPVAALVASLLLPLEHRPYAGLTGASETQFVRDPKVKRTAKEFLDSEPFIPEPKLSAVNRPGLPIELTLPPEKWELMRRVANRTIFKDRSVPATIRFADRQPRAAVVHLRGGGSLNDAKKPNFRVEMMRSEEIAPQVSGKAIFLMNLSSDPSQLETVFAYRLLRELGLFQPYTQFVAMKVNGEPMGMYLLVEPPDRAIRRNFEDVVSIYRRRGRNIYSTEWTQPIPNADSALDRFIALNFAATREADPVAAYAEVIDLDRLFAWMSVNSAIYNTDMLDELFIYERRADPNRPGRLDIMAWDYDDIFNTRPRSAAFGDPLIYSSLDPFDLKVKSTPALYDRFKGVLRGMLAAELSSERLIGLLDETLAFRNALDDGLPTPEQIAAREERKRAAAEFRALIRRRHADLSDALK